jgi:hypothetical protein
MTTTRNLPLNVSLTTLLPVNMRTNFSYSEQASTTAVFVGSKHGHFS